MHPYPYVRARDLPCLLHVPRDWLASNERGITELIIQRLCTALERFDTPCAAIRTLSLKWALEAERQQLAQGSRVEGRGSRVEGHASRVKA